MIYLTNGIYIDWFSLNNLNLHEWISLKFMWYIGINKTQLEFQKEDSSSIW